MTIVTGKVFVMSDMKDQLLKTVGDNNLWSMFIGADSNLSPITLVTNSGAEIVFKLGNEELYKIDMFKLCFRQCRMFSDVFI